VVQDRNKSGSGALSDNVKDQNLKLLFQAAGARNRRVRSQLFCDVPDRSGQSGQGVRMEVVDNEACRPCVRTPSVEHGTRNRTKPEGWRKNRKRREASRRKRLKIRMSPLLTLKKHTENFGKFRFLKLVAPPCSHRATTLHIPEAVKSNCVHHFAIVGGPPALTGGCVQELRLLRFHRKFFVLGHFTAIRCNQVQLGAIRCKKRRGLAVELRNSLHHHRFPESNGSALFDRETLHAAPRRGRDEDSRRGGCGR
jgi:hypothetical protein